MNKIERINCKGRMVDAERLSFINKEEHWSQYVIEDGAIIRFKVEALTVHKVVGETDKDGNPLYVMQFKQAMVLAKAPIKDEKIN